MLRKTEGREKEQTGRLLAVTAWDHFTFTMKLLNTWVISNHDCIDSFNVFKQTSKEDDLEALRCRWFFNQNNEGGKYILEKSKA